MITHRQPENRMPSAANCWQTNQNQIYENLRVCLRIDQGLAPETIGAQHLIRAQPSDLHQGLTPEIISAQHLIRAQPSDLHQGLAPEIISTQHLIRAQPSDLYQVSASRRLLTLVTNTLKIRSLQILCPRSRSKARSMPLLGIN